VRTVGIELGVVAVAALVYKPWRKLVERAGRGAA